MKRAGKTVVFWAVAILWMELVLHWTVFGGLSAKFLWAVGFSVSAAGFLGGLSHLCESERKNRVIQVVLLALLIIPYVVQLVYFRVFDAMLSLAYVGQGGEAIGHFLPMVMSGIARSALPLILTILPPYVLLFALRRARVLDGAPVGRAAELSMLGAWAALWAASAGVMQLSPFGTVRMTYTDAYATVDRQAEYFGLLTAERLELGRLNSDGVQFDPNGMDLTAGDTSTTADERNIMTQIDFDKLAAAAPNDMIGALNSHLSSLAGTNKNEYTGKFAGYNLITITAEAFSPYLVDPERTPTLYRLSHEGFVFKNFYNSFPSLTTNGEYSFCMGLMPDMTRLSFATSVNNYLPFCTGRVFRDQAGINTRAYHNNIGTFYNRINTHTNMGFDFKAINFGLDVERQTPSSDLEMMQKTVDEYINDPQFVVHYMSYSGHADYNFTENSMSIKNRSRVENLDCSEELKAYYACQLELEDALTYLVDRLEQAGVADRTVIVISGDHYPYGLSDETYQELAGDATSEPFWRYRNSFICWNGGMEQPIEVDNYTCGQDILPTILNLFGMEYDSRLLTGVDALSDATHIALLQDGSLLTDAFLYDSSTGGITWQKDESDYPADYAMSVIRGTKNEFSVAATILRTDYYRFVFSTLGLADTTQMQKTYASYADISGEWYEDAVENLTGRGALTGTTSGNFNGALPATHSTYLVMLTRTLYLETPPDQTPPFSDVKKGDWDYNAVTAAWSAGLFGEVPEGTEWGSNDPVTAEQAQTLLAAAADYAGIRNPDDWAAKITDEVLAESAAHGENTTDELTRSAVAVMVSHLVDEVAADDRG